MTPHSAMDRLMVFSGNANPKLAQDVVRQRAEKVQEMIDLVDQTGATTVRETEIVTGADPLKSHLQLPNERKNLRNP